MVNGWQFHCSNVERYEARAIPCPENAVVVFESKDGWKIGFCELHRFDGEQHAKYRGWKMVEPIEVAA